MPKSLPHKGLLAVSGGALSDAVLRHCGLKGDPVAEARANVRALRGVIERRPDLAAWIGARLHARDTKPVLTAFVNELGLNLPPSAKPPGARTLARKPIAAMKSSRTKRAASPSSEAAIAS